MNPRRTRGFQREGVLRTLAERVEQGGDRAIPADGAALPAVSPCPLWQPGLRCDQEVTMTLQRKPPPTTSMTYADLASLPTDRRFELIDGALYAMAPAPSLNHQDVVGELFAQLKARLEGSPCRAFVAPLDVRLPRGTEADNEIDTVVQPDVLVVCDASKLDRRGVRGAPDWVCEVVSPGSASHDHIHKRRVYERAGVREFWLVHPGDRVVTIYRHDGKGYGRPDVQTLEGETRIEVLSAGESGSAGESAAVVVDWAKVVRWLPPAPPEESWYRLEPREAAEPRDAIK